MLSVFGYVVVVSVEALRASANFASIQGLGPIGQCVARFAKLKGASRVIGIDRVPERLKMAQEGGIETLDFSQHKDVVKRFQEIAPGGLDVALDCGTCLSYRPRANRL